MVSKIFYTCVVIMLLLYSCTKQEQNPFEISKNRVGFLTHETPVSALDSIYALDSIVNLASVDQNIGGGNEIEIYEKGGTKLMVLEPREGNDGTETIKNIQLIDTRYTTASGLSTASTFKDIKENYPISKINNTLSAAVVFIDTIQAYITIDKKALPEKYRTTTDAVITPSVIPDTAKIKHFWIQWEEE